MEIKNGVPCPLMKWGEEGYIVVEITEAAVKTQGNALDIALSEIRKCSATDPKGHVGLVGKSNRHPRRNTWLTSQLV